MTITVSPGLAAALSGEADPPRAVIADPRTLRRNEIDGFDVADRLAAILTADVSGRVRAALRTESPSELLDRCADLEAFARALVGELEMTETRAVRAVERSRAYRAHQETTRAATERLEAVRAAQAGESADLLARVESMCAHVGLTLETRPRYGEDGPDLYRVITDDPAHPLLPSAFDRPVERAAVDVLIRGGRRWFVLPGPAGMTLAHIEAWLTHCGGGAPAHAPSHGAV
ncbi:hypothetical protein ACWDUL_23170 [Nocardia niigatensis]